MNHAQAMVLLMQMSWITAVVTGIALTLNSIRRHLEELTEQKEKTENATK